jgi:hypothetical protein
MAELNIYVSHETGLRIITIEALRQLGRYNNNGVERDHIAETGVTDGELSQFLNNFS